MKTGEKNLLEQLTHSYNIRIKALHHLSCTDRILCRRYMQHKKKRNTSAQHCNTCIVQKKATADHKNIKYQQKSQFTISLQGHNQETKIFFIIFFVFLSKQDFFMTSVKSSIFTAYSNVNNLHYKAHSWRFATWGPQRCSIKGWKRFLVFIIDTLHIWHTNC